jgi:hypothetical protein
MGAMGPPDTADIGEAAEEALLFAGGDGIKVQQVATDDSQLLEDEAPVMGLDEDDELGEADEEGAQRDDRISAPVEDVSRQHAPKFVASDERAIDLRTIMRKRVEPKDVVPVMDPERKEAAKKMVKMMIERLRKQQTAAVDAEVAADKALDKADEQKRLATVKNEKEARKVLKREVKLRKKAKDLQVRAAAKKKRAIAMKLTMKNQVKQMMAEGQTVFRKAHFNAQKAELERADKETQMMQAKEPQPEHAKNECEINFKNQRLLCLNATKTAMADAKAKLQENADNSLAKTKENECIKKITKNQQVCMEALTKDMEATSKATHTMDVLNSAYSQKEHAFMLARALAKYKDVPKPKKPDGPVGLFQHKSLVFLANKDGTRTWIKFPTDKCAIATAHVVPQQFPISADKPFFDKTKSEVACEGAAFTGIGNPDFYEDCECNGMENKKEHGGHCDMWGYKFNWCYVNNKCGYGNTAYSDELNDQKVLVGCRKHPPSIDTP